MSFTIFIKKSFLFFDSLRYRKFSKIMVREIEFPSQTVIDIFPTTHDHAHDPILAWWRKKQVMTFCSPCFIGIFNTVQAHPSRQMHHPGLGRPFAWIPPIQGRYSSSGTSSWPHFTITHPRLVQRQFPQHSGICKAGFRQSRACWITLPEREFGDKASRPYRATNANGAGMARAAAKPRGLVMPVR